MYRNHKAENIFVFNQLVTTALKSRKVIYAKLNLNPVSTINNQKVFKRVINYEAYANN